MARGWQWIVWLVGTLVVTGVLGALMLDLDLIQSAPIDRTVFLPGATTDGHYQIEIDCVTCHGDGWEDAGVMQDNCMKCHGSALETADDSHPRSKFLDPRNADRVAILDARSCVTCHQEHRPDITSTMGLSLQPDYCYRCHAEIAEDRPTHRDLPFDSCASSGCHNFHDNRALYEDFLVEHREDPDHRPIARVRLRDADAGDPLDGLSAPLPLTAADHDAPEALPGLAGALEEWLASAHAEAAINCSECHAPDGQPWQNAVGIDACQTCHEFEREGFLASRHGMRLAAGLSPMTPGQARLPMHADSAEVELDCSQCHAAHRYDTRAAAVEACLGCHVDEHSLAYEESPHSLSWRVEASGETPAGSGVSCATCHLPRVKDRKAPNRTRVAHNQNDFLRPSEAMIRPVCLACHGLAFSIDALADPDLVTQNFRGRPSREIESMHYATTLRWELQGKEPPWSERPREEER